MYFCIPIEIEKSELLIKKEESGGVLEESGTPLKKDDITEENPLPIDWKPQDKCYFCVDGKLLTVNEAGELVAESGPVQTTEADLTNNRVRLVLTQVSSANDFLTVLIV